jgi:hypothetical protein
MNDIKKGILLLIFILALVSNAAFAHPGGHYHQHDHLNSWQLKNGNKIEGNFSFAENGMVFLEQLDGHFMSLPINQLSEEGQKLVTQKTSQFTALNQAPKTNPSIPLAFNKINPLLIAFALTLIIIGLVMLLYKIIMLIPGQKLAFALLFLVTISFGFTQTSLPKTAVSYLENAFKAYQPNVKTSYDKTNFYVASNGIPNHNMMVGITNWQQQVPVPQDYTGQNSWTIPLQPAYAKEILSTKTNFMRGAIALAVNGIPIFNALNNRGEDSYLIGELDHWGGHCGKGDDYHYHVAPLSLQATSGNNPIAFALDGFAIYGDKEPDGSPVKPLDAYHGHEDGKGSYHYHGTKEYPYTIGAMRGVVKTDNTSSSENQIIPQAVAAPFRPPLRPLRGAEIIDCKALGENAYQLVYTQNDQKGFVNYKWDDKNNFTIEQISPTGEKNTNTYERKNKKPKQ